MFSSEPTWLIFVDGCREVTKKFFSNQRDCESIQLRQSGKRERLSHFNCDHVTVNFLAFHHIEYFEMIWKNKKWSASILLKLLTNYRIFADNISNVCYWLAGRWRRRRRWQQRLRECWRYVCCYQLTAVQVCLLHINISRNSHKNHDTPASQLNDPTEILKQCNQTLATLSNFEAIQFNQTYMRTRDAINWKIIIAIKIRNKLIINSIRFNERYIRSEWKKKRSHMN